MNPVRNRGLGLIGVPFLALVVASCGTPVLEKNQGMIWKTKGYAGKADPRFFPEQGIPAIARKPNLGVCFSGGGNRSAAATLGELRALFHTGILQQVRYVSAVSGGSWGSGPWVFLQDATPEKDLEFLGRAKRPSELTLSDFTEVPSGSFAESLANADFPRTIAVHALFHSYGDEGYANEIARIYLDRHFSKGLNVRQRFPVYDAATLAGILKRNPQLTKDDFLVCTPGRPYFIAGAAIVRRARPLWALERRMIPAELTTNYSGVHGFFPVTKGPFQPPEIPVGGGYSENVIYDGIPIALQRVNAAVPTWKVRSKMARDSFFFCKMSPRFSLADMLAAAGAAPSAALPSLADAAGTPEFNYVTPEALPEVERAELMHTDGGAVENLGIVPLLARGVKNIIVFANSEKSYKPPVWNEARKAFEGDEFRPQSLNVLFGRGNPCGVPWNVQRRQMVMDHVIEDPEGAKFRKLQQVFDQAARRNLPLIHWDTYRVRTNDYHQIQGGWDVRICWIYLGPPLSEGEGSSPTPQMAALTETSWFAEIENNNPKLACFLRKRRDLQNFPHYATFFNNKPYIIDLTNVQVNALAHFSGYPVLLYSDRIKSFLGLD